VGVAGDRDGGDHAAAVVEHWRGHGRDADLGLLVVDAVPALAGAGQLLAQHACLHDRPRGLAHEAGLDHPAQVLGRSKREEDLAGGRAVGGHPAADPGGDRHRTAA
jgi:hypothetical protein